MTGFRRTVSSASPQEMITLETMRLQLVELRLTVEGLEKERDFYFEKLAAIENVVSESDNEIHNVIKEVLYKVDN